MQIEFVDFVAGAKKSHGVAVVIDVFRAFTTACYCVAAGAERIIAVASREQALSYRDTYHNPILLGERFGQRLPGFDFGNSPSELMGRSMNNHTVVHTTHAGTQGLVNAAQADRVFTGALVNAAATARYIRNLKPEVVTLVRMGLHANERCDEDWLCADYLAALIRGAAVDEAEIARLLRRSPNAARFFDPEQPWSPAADFDCCVAFDQFNFVLEAQPLEAGACQLRVLTEGDL